MNRTKSISHSPGHKNIILNGFRQATPIILGYIPISFAYGVLAQEAGLSFVNTLLMSLIVYAGSSQLIAVGLFSTGINPISIVITTFIVNLRHSLMSASLSPMLRSWSKPEIAFFSFEITDESFAVHSIRSDSQEFIENTGHKIEMFLVNIISQSSWFLGSLLGFSIGQMITDVKIFGLDYALIAMFIALIILQIKNIRQVIVLTLSGILSTLFYIYGIDQWNVIFATIICATFGVFIEKWTKE